jgi:TonB family protein
MHVQYRLVIIAAALVFTHVTGLASTQMSPEWARQWVISMPQPEYPEAARLRRITGSGFFKLHVHRATGRVTEIIVLRSTGNNLLDASALRTLRQWRFKPGVLPSTGQSKSTQAPYSKPGFFIRVPVSFQLERDGIITKT